MIDFKKIIQSNKNTLYVFKHIPKTAGTSVRMQMIEDYEPDEIFCFYDETVAKHCFCDEREFFRKKQNDSEKNLNQVKILIGHTVTEKVALSFNRPVKYLTIIREPVERVISLYYHDLQKRYRSEGKPWAEVRALTKDSLKNDFSFWFDNLNFTQSFISNFINFRDGGFKNKLYSDEAYLKEAMETLDSFDFLGVMNQPETFSKIKKALKLSRDIGVYNEGHYETHHGIEELAKAKILEKWPLDFKIYEYALQLI